MYTICSMLTKKQKNLLLFINKKLRSSGVSPSYEEMKESLNLKSNDFSLCVEIPINIKKKGLSYTDIPSYERKRIAGFKKVNAFRDGFKILVYMLRRFIFG